MKEVSEIASQNVVLALVGNKLDLEAERAVKREEGENLAKDNNMSFVEVSACTGTNLTEIFEEIGRRALKEIAVEPKQGPDDCKSCIIVSNTIGTSIEFYRRCRSETRWSSAQ